MQEGSLYIIASPIGNPEDMTIRSLHILQNVIDIVYCEDTRETGKILSFHNIKKPLRSLHMHSDEKKIIELINEIKSGKNVGYMTDSGTPSLSDPGSKVVAVARSNGINIIPIPGVSALATLVSVSGFPEKRILFAGFLSKKPGKRLKELKSLSETEAIIIIYESPHRIKKTLSDIKTAFPGREICIGREMTKKFEEFLCFNSKDMESILTNLTEKGEFSIAILNKKIKGWDDEE